MSVITSNGYQVHIGEESLTHLASLIEERSEYSQYFILVDENTIQACLPILFDQVPALKDAQVIETESGEVNKTIEVVTQVWLAMSDHHADRKTLVINLGGGVISDMGGFIASTYKRGVHFLNIPTTLLSQVDASVGGKLGIDLGGLKNQIGVFNYPQGVFVNPLFLKSLPFEQLRSGFAEVLKHALIKDLDYWKTIKGINWSEDHDWQHIIQHSIGIKNEVVMKDPTEQGARKSLNYGHTIGHAIETCHLESKKLTTLLHGEAIAIGMVAEAFLSSKHTQLPETDLEDLVEVIGRFFPLPTLSDADFDQYMSLMIHDKKNQKGKISFSLLNEIGRCEWDVFCNKSDILAALNYYNEKAKKDE